MSELPTEEPCFEELKSQADFPNSDMGETSDYRIYNLNFERGIGVYRRFRYEGEIPGKNQLTENAVGVEFAHLTEGQENSVLYLHDIPSDRVFEYNDSVQNLENGPDRGFETGEIGSMRNKRAGELLTP